MLGITELIDEGRLEPIEVYSKSMNRFGEIVGYFEDDGVGYAMVSFELVEAHMMPTYGDMSTCAELSLDDLILMSAGVMKQPLHGGRP